MKLDSTYEAMERERNSLVQENRRLRWDKEFLKQDNAHLRNQITEIQLGAALEGVHIDLVPRKIIPAKVVEEHIDIKRVRK